MLQGSAFQHTGCAVNIGLRASEKANHPRDEDLASCAFGEISIPVFGLIFEDILELGIRGRGGVVDEIEKTTNNGNNEIWQMDGWAGDLVDRPDIPPSSYCYSGYLNSVNRIRPDDGNGYRRPASH